jgi:lipoate-protein ligase A
MSGWRLIDDREPQQGAWNMAVDEMLFAAAEEGRADGPVLRLYAWRPWCLSIGYHQELREVCDRGHCLKAGYDVVRRATGGKAVLHADEITYAIVARHDETPFSGGGLTGTYGLIAEALAASLKVLGLKVTTTMRSLPIPPKGGTPCFLVPSEKEILVEGRKVVGSAQRRGARAFLQHGAIPLHLDYEELARATGQDGGQIDMYRRAFAGIADVNPAVNTSALRAAIARGFRSTFGGEWTARPLTDGEKREAERIRKERYASRAWTEKVASSGPEAINQ